MLFNTSVVYALWKSVIFWPGWPYLVTPKYPNALHGTETQIYSNVSGKNNQNTEKEGGHAGFRGFLMWANAKIKYFISIIITTVVIIIFNIVRFETKVVAVFALETEY